MIDGSTGHGPPLLDLQGLLAGLNWRRRLWCSLALLGFLAGALMFVLNPPPPAAETRVLLVYEDGQVGSESDIAESNLALLNTTRIAADAIARLGIVESPQDFRARFRAESLSSDVLEITVEGKTTADAILRAQALTDAFLADHIRRAETLANAESEVLRGQQADAERQLAELDAKISARSSPVDALILQRASLSVRIEHLGDHANAVRRGAPRAAAGSQVVDPPHVKKPGMIPENIELPFVGLILGLGAGLAVAAVATIVRDCPVLRRDITEHLGASVIAQVPAPRGPFRLWKRRGKVECRRIAASVARTARGASQGFSLLELGCADTAVDIAFRIADELARERPVVVVDGLPRRQACKRAPSADGEIQVLDAVEYSGGRTPSGPQSGRCIGIGSVGPGTAWTDLGLLGAETLLVVRAGRFSASWLHTVARQLADAEIFVIGIILVHPDPRDRTDGTLWDCLHHALRGRVPTTPPVSGLGDQPRAFTTDLAHTNGAMTDHSAVVAPQLVMAGAPVGSPSGSISNGSATLSPASDGAVPRPRPTPWPRPVTPAAAGAAIQGADVESADVESADVESADVESADVESADVESADVESADVESADVESADVESADVESADVESADTENADTENADTGRNGDIAQPDFDQA